MRTLPDAETSFDNSFEMFGLKNVVWEENAGHYWAKIFPKEDLAIFDHCQHVIQNQ